jgi:hypothetical protein
MTQTLTTEEIVKKSIFVDEEREQPSPLITIANKVILTENNFITISGLPKSRKTSFMQFFIASAITGKTEVQIKTNINKGDKIVLIDTEQSIHDFSKQNKFLKRIIEKQKLPNFFSAYLFREYEPETILQAIELICEQQKPKLIFIDNLTELAINPNDIAEAKKIIQFLKRITTKYNLGIICLLHLSKSNSFTLGNLGSYADRGAQSVLKVSLDKESDTSTLDCLMLRSDAHFDPITIGYNEEQKRYTETEHRPEEKEKHKKFSMDNFTEEEIKTRVQIIFEMREEYDYSPLITELQKIFGVGQTIAKQKILPYLVYSKIIIAEQGIYTFFTNANNQKQTTKKTKK